MKNRIICDMHVHSRFSRDSKSSIEEYCVRAAESGVDCVCFTEHIDYNPADDGYGYYNAGAFFEEFKRAQDIYAGRVKLLCGVEFSGPHRYPFEFEKFNKAPYDFVIGSVHYSYEGMFPGDTVKAGVPAEACYESHWKEVLAAVSFGGFDCLAHIDFPKRYYGKLLFDEAQMHTICETMIKNGIYMEINTSTLRKGLPESMPGKGILEIYRATGGKYATVGSDAHAACELAAGRQHAEGLIKELGLTEVIFIGRKSVNATAG